MVRQSNKPETISEAKQRFRTTSAKIEYLNTIKRNPIKSTASAFLAGIIWGRFKKKAGLPPGLLEIALQVIKRI